MLLKTALRLASPGGKSGTLSILIFHRVLAQADPLFPDEVDIPRFDSIVSWLKQWFSILPLDDALARLKRGELPSRAAAITFDDGYADNLTLAAPILRKHGVPATFFIATGYLDGGRMWNDTVIESIRHARPASIDVGHLGLGRLPVDSVENKRNSLARLIPAIKHLPGAQRSDAVCRIAEACGASLPDDLMMSSSQLRTLRGLGMQVGAHTVNHPILAKMDRAEARREIADSRDFLEGLLGERIGLFAYPNGRFGNDYTSEHAAIVKELGFDAAVATNWGVSRAATDVYRLPRFTPWDRTRFRFGLRLLSNHYRNA